MLSRGDLQVVRRDPGVPGLRLLLDDDALSEWLSHRLANDIRVRGSYLRYKPGTSCVLRADVLQPEHRFPMLIWAYSSEVLVKLTKTLKVARPDAVLASDLRLGVLVTTPAADRDLPTVGRLLQDEAWRARLVQDLLPGREDLREPSVHTMRYKPGRRWVGRLSMPEHPDVVLRIYPPAQVRAVAGAVASCAGDAPRCPAVLATHVRLGVIAVEYLDGTVLSDVRGRVPTDELWRAGAALAQLHDRGDIVLHTGGAATQTSATETAARYVAQLLPDLRTEVQALACTVVERLAHGSQACTPLHGDFSADQVVLRPSGDVALIDLDAAHRGDSAVDLACAVAAMTSDTVLGEVTAEQAAQWREALFDGYSSVRPLPAQTSMAVHEAEHLLRRAVEPFRLRLCEDWPTATRELVRQAKQSLGATVGGVVR